MESMSAKPHLLYVAWGYPPCRGSGVYRAWATANAFARAGWRVTVLTVPRETFTMSTGVDLSLEETIDPSIEIVRVPFTSATFANDLRAWSRWRASAPELWNGWDGWRGQRSFPERNYGGWRPALESAAREVHRRTPVDLVIGTANPHVDFVPGHVLNKEHGVPYVMDYRDAWQLDVFTGERMTATGSRVDRWERELMKDASAVWFVNEPIRAWHAGVHPDQAHKFHVVANGYDDPFTGTPPARTGDEGLVFGYVGTLTGSVPLAELVAGWARARERSELVARSTLELWGHLNHTGIPNETVVRQLESFAEHAIEYRGPVRKRDIEAVYERFDALILLLGTGRYVTSGKVYEYAATGLPIVSVHDPANAASDVLRGWEHWHPVAALDAESIADALIAGAEQALQWPIDERLAARARAVGYQRDAQLAPQIAALAATVARGAGVGSHA